MEAGRGIKLERFARLSDHTKLISLLGELSRGALAPWRSGSNCTAGFGYHIGGVCR